MSTEFQNQAVAEEWEFLDDHDEYEVITQILDPLENGMQLVTFTLEDEKYGLDILKVKELIRYSETTPIPNMPAFVTGVLNLRGLIIPVIDLRARFGMAPKVYGAYSVIIIVRVEEKKIGIIVDAVSDVVFLHENDLRPPPDFPALIDTDYIQGMGELRNELVIVLNIDQMLSVEEMQKCIRSEVLSKEPTPGEASHVSSL